jgi:hypothetical protein
MTSDSTVEHLTDSFQGLPDAHVIVKHPIPKSKSQFSRETRLHRAKKNEGSCTPSLGCSSAHWPVTQIRVGFGMRVGGGVGINQFKFTGTSLMILFGLCGVHQPLYLKTVTVGSSGSRIHFVDQSCQPAEASCCQGK